MADATVAVVVADHTGREDIEYSAIIDQSIICDDRTLAVTRSVGDERLWLLGPHFANCVADLDLVGIVSRSDLATFAAVG